MMHLGGLSRYRTELMGLSAVLILVCHVYAYVELPGVMRYMLSLCNIGVDLFLLTNLNVVAHWVNYYRYYYDRNNSPFGIWLFILYLTVVVCFLIYYKNKQNGGYNFC